MIPSFARTRHLAFVLILCGASAQLSQGQNPREVTAFVHVNVVPMDLERVLGDQTVIVIGDRIQEMGTYDEVHVPSEAIVIDGKGKFLMPGLADMHMHLWYEGDLLVYVANGVTTVRNLFGGPAHLEWREQIKRGERLGPTIHTSGPIVDGDPPRWSESDVATTPEAAREIVAAQARAGYDFIKIYNGLSTDVYGAVIKAAREHGLPVVGHVPTAVGVLDVLESRQSSIEHMDGFGVAVSTEDQPRADAVERLRSFLGGWEDLDEAKMAELAEQTREAGAWICPTLLALEEFNLPEQIASRLQAPQMRFVDPNVLEFWRQTQNDPAVVEFARRAAPGRKRGLKLLHDAGVPILLGTDSPNELLVPGFSILRELREMVDAGLTPFEAIKAGTNGAATFLDAADEFGTVTEGKRADLILIEGNPLEDVENVAKRAGVMLRGVWYPEDDLRSRLEELAHRYEIDAAASKTPDGSCMTAASTYFRCPEHTMTQFAIQVGDRFTAAAWILWLGRLPDPVRRGSRT